MVTLKNLCLNLISEEFQRFHFAFTVSNNQALKRNFEFLQRKYSYELARDLFEKRKLKKEYLDFLLNEHLKILDFDWLDFTLGEYSVKDIFCRLPNLTELSCEVCDDEILENVAKFCPNIIEIRSLWSWVTDNGIKYLCKNEDGVVPCPKLKNLLIDNLLCCMEEVTKEVIELLLQDLPFIERMDNIPDILYLLHKADLPKLDNIRNYNFVEIDMLAKMYSENYSNLLKICLYSCPKLKSFSCIIFEEEQFNFFRSTCIENLKLCFPEEIEKINVNNFLKTYGPNLTCIFIDNCIMSISELASSCPNLHSLQADYVTFLQNDNSEFVFNYLTKCTVFQGKNDNFTHKAICLILSSSPKLEYIELSISYISSELKAHILKCCENHQLKEIHFSYMNVNIDFVKEILLSCVSLTTLDLCSCGYHSYQRDELIAISETLPNKPIISVRGLLIVVENHPNATIDMHKFYNGYDWA